MDAWACLAAGVRAVWHARSLPTHIQHIVPVRSSGAAAPTHPTLAADPGRAAASPRAAAPPRHQSPAAPAAAPPLHPAPPPAGSPAGAARQQESAPHDSQPLQRRQVAAWLPQQRPVPPRACTSHLLLPGRRLQQQRFLAAQRLQLLQRRLLELLVQLDTQPLGEPSQHLHLDEEPPAGQGRQRAGLCSLALLTTAAGQAPYIRAGTQ